MLFLAGDDDDEDSDVSSTGESQGLGDSFSHEKICKNAVTRNRYTSRTKYNYRRNGVKWFDKKHKLNARKVRKRRTRKENVGENAEIHGSNWLNVTVDDDGTQNCDDSNLSTDVAANGQELVQVNVIPVDSPLSVDVTSPESTNTVSIVSKPQTPVSSTSHRTSDSHKRARKFLYHLVPLLKLSLPSRVERKRTAHKFCVAPIRPGPRASICEKQWTKYGVPIHHCPTFMDYNPPKSCHSLSTTHTAQSTTLLNADLYVQRLWRELQLHCRDKASLDVLDSRNTLAKTLVLEISTFLLSKPNDPPPWSSLNLYLESLEAANEKVSLLLEQVDCVEQCWSSEARLKSEVVDWALPEIASRLTYLRQWASRYSILKNGFHQLCAFLHYSAQSTCDASHHHADQTDLSSCPLLLDKTEPGRSFLFRQFLRSCRSMPPFHGTFTSTTAELDRDATAVVFALIRLDRLIQRILIEFRGNRLKQSTFAQTDLSTVPAHVKSTQTPNRIHSRPAYSMFTQTDAHLSAPELSTLLTSPETPVKCSTSTLLSPREVIPPARLHVPSPSPVFISPKLIVSSPTGDITSLPDCNNQMLSDSAPFPWDRTARQDDQPCSRSVSYASVLRRRSWCARSPPVMGTPELLAHSVERLPVNWEICSSVHSPSSLRERSASGSSVSSGCSLPNTHSSQCSSSSTDSGSVSNFSPCSSSSSAASLTSHIRVRCTTSTPSLGTTSTESLLQLDLCTGFARSPPPADEADRLGLPSLMPLSLTLSRVAFAVNREAVSIKLEQLLERLKSDTQINPFSTTCMINESQAMLLSSVRIAHHLRRNVYLISTRPTLRPFMRSPKCRSTATSSFESESDLPAISHRNSLHPHVNSTCLKWIDMLNEEICGFLNDGGDSEQATMPKLLKAHVEAVMLLLLSECRSGSERPSDLKCRVEQQWQFLRRLYRKVRLCRGAVYSSDISLDASTYRRAETTITQCIRRFLHFVSNELTPLVEGWVRSIMLSSVSGSTPVKESNGDAHDVNAHLENCPYVGDEIASTSMFMFQEFNDVWRGMRCWLHCLLDIGGLLCSDLDNSVRVSLCIPVNTGLKNDCHSPELKPEESTMKVYRKLNRQLIDRGYVLLHAWDQSSEARNTNSLWDRGCIFIWSPILLARTKTSHPEKHHKAFPVVIESTKLRCAIRKHVARLVHRLTSQIIFRSHSSRTLCDDLVQQGLHQDGCHAETEHLLVFPGLSATLWSGLVYNIGSNSGLCQTLSNIRSIRDRKLFFELDWFINVCQSASPTSSSQPINTDEGRQLIPVSLWLLSEHPHATWTAFRNFSRPIRRWLTFGSTAGTTTLLGKAAVAPPIQLVPILADLCQEVANLRRSFCDLSAQVQGYLLIIESHLASPDSDQSYLSEVPNTGALHRSVSCTGREFPLLTVDAIQRTYSVVFGFHKTLLRLMTAAPLSLPPMASSTNSLSSDCGNVSLPLQTRLVHLGVHLLTNWTNFIISRYSRGRGRIPRWANDACHFAYQLCQPRLVNFLQVEKVSSLEATLNHLIPYLIGETSPPKDLPSPTGSISSSPLRNPLSFRYSSIRLNSPILRHRRVHSSHMQRKPSPGSCATSLTKQKQKDSIDRLCALSRLDLARDMQLRSRGLIGHPLTLRTESYSHGRESENSVSLSSKRHFPYSWNRGRLIGQGITGKVFQAFNLHTQEMMAVKEINFDYDSTSQDTGRREEAQQRLQSFRRECDLLAGLSHPALVRFLGADEQTPNVLRLFTELCTAGTLADIAKERPAELLVRRYANDLARAVIYLHERGIVHRDIKPSNVFLVGPSNNPSSPHRSLLKLGDFSHSLRLHSLSSTARGTAGTVCYMAPEVCRDLDSGYGRPCDIWSYCCVLLELLTGRPPDFGVRDMYAIFFRLCNDAIPSLPKVGSWPLINKTNGTNCVQYASEEAVCLLKSGFQADPLKRPTAVELFEFNFIRCPDVKDEY